MPIKHHDLRHFPREYFDIIEEVAIEDKLVRLDLGTYKEALRVRGSFYAFVGALKKAVGAIKDPEKQDPGNRLRDTLERSFRVMVLVQSDGTLEFQNRDRSALTKALRERKILGTEERIAETEKELEQLGPEGLAKLLAAQEEADRERKDRDED